MGGSFHSYVTNYQRVYLKYRSISLHIAPCSPPRDLGYKTWCNVFGPRHGDPKKSDRGVKIEFSLRTIWKFNKHLGNSAKKIKKKWLKKFNQHQLKAGWWWLNHLEKYEFVNGKDDIPYTKWKIKVMFQTNNQYITIIFPLLLVYSIFNHY